MDNKIKEVYEQYKHLDILLSDFTWIKGDEPSLLRYALFDMWQAIKITMEE